MSDESHACLAFCIEIPEDVELHDHEPGDPDAPNSLPGVGVLEKQFGVDHQLAGNCHGTTKNLFCSHTPMMAWESWTTPVSEGLFGKHGGPDDVAALKGVAEALGIEWDSVQAAWRLFAYYG